MNLARAIARTTTAVVAAVAAGAMLTSGAVAAPVSPEKEAARERVSAASAADSGIYQAGTALPVGTALTSSDGRDRFVMQADGNLVLYTDGRARWQSRTSGNAGARAVFQTDGNLVVYSATNRALWSSRTNGLADAQLYLGHGDVIVASFDDEGDARVWQAKTGRDRLRAGQTLTGGQAISENPVFWYEDASEAPLTRLVMQADGNAVLYDFENTVLWASNTNRNPGARLVMQTDGNLVVYSSSNRALWQSKTRGAGNSAVINGFVRDLEFDGERFPVLPLAEYLLVVNSADRLLTSRPI